MIDFTRYPNNILPLPLLKNHGLKRKSMRIETSMDSGYSRSRNRFKNPPSLIIQDELHLISGPLGTIAGIYETGFDSIMEILGHKPKVIAATATIRSANQQVNRLFGRNVAIFPPSGTDEADSFFSKRKEQFASSQSEFEDNYSIKDQFCQQLAKALTTLSEESDWSALAQQFKQAQKDWRILGHVPRAKEEEINTRFKALCDEFFTKRNEHFDQLSNEDRNNLAAKEELCLEAEVISESSEWQETTQAFKDMQEKWKTLSSINEKYDGIMQHRFTQVCQGFFAKRKDAYEVLDAQRHENLEKKEALLKRMADLAGTEFTTNIPSTETIEDLAASLKDAWAKQSFETEKKSENYSQASQEVRELQAAWKEIGPVPKKYSQQIWQDFKKATDAFYNKRQKRFENRQQKQEA